MYKITLAIIAALVAPTTAGKLKEFKCHDDLVVVGFADSNCTKYAWEVAVRDPKAASCDIFPGYKIDNQSVWYGTKECNEKYKSAWISLNQDDKCSKQYYDFTNGRIEYLFRFNETQCMTIKNLDKNGAKDGMEYLYYSFARNDTMYQKWKNGNMTNGKEAAHMRNGKEAAGMSASMNGNKMNMTKGNMSTSINFTVEGIKVDGSMNANNRTWQQKMNVSGDGYEWSWNMSESKNNNMTRKNMSDPKQMNHSKKGMKKNTMMEYRVKFDKYFEYGMQASGMAKGSMTKQCSNTKDCNGMYYSKMCCVSSIITDKKSGTQDSMFRCMNYRLAQANFQMKMNDFAIQMQCTDSQSSAVKMTSAFVASMVSMILMALY